MNNEEQRYYVMTYGTLMRGRGNHTWMTTSQGEFIEEVVSTESDFVMYSVHESFPAITKNGDSNFYGELYAVPGQGILYGLDYLEGYPTMYDRQIISCKGLSTGKDYKALVYTFTPTASASLGNNLLEPKQSKFIKYENNCYKWVG